MNRGISLEGKVKLPQKVQDTVLEASNICRQIVKGSKLNDNLTTSIKNFSLQEAAIDNSDANLKRMLALTDHLKAQASNVESSVATITETQEQLLFLERKHYWAPASSD